MLSASLLLGIGSFLVGVGGLVVSYLSFSAQRSTHLFYAELLNKYKEIPKIEKILTNVAKGDFKKIYEILILSRMVFSSIRRRAIHRLIALFSFNVIASVIIGCNFVNTVLPKNTGPIELYDPFILLLVIAIGFKVLKIEELVTKRHEREFLKNMNKLEDFYHDCFVSTVQKKVNVTITTILANTKKETV